MLRLTRWTRPCLMLCAALIPLMVDANDYNRDHGPFENAAWPAPFPLEPCVSLPLPADQQIAAFELTGCYGLEHQPKAPRLLTARRPGWLHWWLFVLGADGRILAGPKCIAQPGVGEPQVWAADLNADGRLDYVVNVFLGGVGTIYTTSSYVTHVLSLEHGYSLSTSLGQWPGTNSFVDLDRDGRCEFIHTRFVNGIGVTCSDGKRHNFWVYHILQSQPEGLVLRNDLARDFPRWIWYSHRPNHEPTTLLTAEQKEVLWQPYANDLFWSPAKGPRVGRVQRDGQSDPVMDPLILARDPD